MTIVNFNRCVQPSFLVQHGVRHRPDSNASIGCASIELSTLVAVVNELFAVGLDLAAARSVAEDETAERLDRAIVEIDAAISTIRLAAMPRDRVIQRRCDGDENAMFETEPTRRR